jgi:hypothetical protein
MPRQSRDAPRSRPRPDHPLPRQHQQKPLSKPTMMARERILGQMSDLVAACEEFFQEHGEECTCDGCCLVSNFVGSLRLYEMVLGIT